MFFSSPLECGSSVGVGDIFLDKACLAQPPHQPFIRIRIEQFRHDAAKL